MTFPRYCAHLHAYGRVVVGLALGMKGLQVNGAVSESGALMSVGVSTNQWWLMINPEIGVDFEFNPAEVPDGLWPKDSGLSVDLQHMTAYVRSKNAEMHFELAPGGASVSLTITLKDRSASYVFTVVALYK